eukprot:scaffold316515_cov31-Tisochrysis_lutea.AAC.1
MIEELVEIDGDYAASPLPLPPPSSILKVGTRVMRTTCTTTNGAITSSGQGTLQCTKTVELEFFSGGQHLQEASMGCKGERARAGARAFSGFCLGLAKTENGLFGVWVRGRVRAHCALPLPCPSHFPSCICVWVYEKEEH